MLGISRMPTVDSVEVAFDRSMDIPPMVPDRVPASSVILASSQRLSVAAEAWIGITISATRTSAASPLRFLSRWGSY